MRFTKFTKTVLFLVGAIAVASGIGLTDVLAQATDDTIEQRESIRSDQQDTYILPKIEDVDAVFQKLKERAEAKIKERQQELFRKTKVEAGLFGGVETNPLNKSDGANADLFMEERLSFQWLPTFTEDVGADIGYQLDNVHYFDFTDLNFIDNSVHAALKYYATEDIRLEPGVEFKFVNFTNDDRSSYNQTDLFLKVQNFVSRDWNYGGRYTYSFKTYDAFKARNDAGADISGLDREDTRNTIDAFLTRYLEDWIVRLRGKFFRNDSNDNFQNYYDYNSFRFYVTLARSFMDGDLYVGITPNYERRDYDDRLTGTSERHDNIMQWDINTYYTVNSNVTLDYLLSIRTADSNDPSGDYSNVTNMLGATYRF